MTPDTSPDKPESGIARADSPGVCIAGTGSYAAEIMEYATAAGFRVAALVELVNSDRVGTTIHGLPVIAPDEPPRECARVAVAAGADRGDLWDELLRHGWSAATIIHPHALIGPSARIGAGSIVGPGAVIGAETELSPQVLVGRGALIGHHVRIGRGAVLNPGSNVAGNVTIGGDAKIGMGAIIVNGISIGDRAIVAAGAVTVRDVPAGSRVQGVPARRFSAAEAP